MMGRFRLCHSVRGVLDVQVISLEARGLEGVFPLHSHHDFGKSSLLGNKRPHPYLEDRKRLSVMFVVEPDNLRQMDHR